MPTSSSFWLGNQSSLEAVITAMGRAESHTRFQAASEMEELNRYAMQRMVQVQDGIAIVNVTGQMVTGSAGYGMFYGLVGYDEIRNAMMMAVQDASVIGVVLNMASGGGAVGGVVDAGDIIRQVSSIKPVVTYTGSYMASAALWCGIGGEYVIAAPNAMVGSIGVMNLHKDMTGYFEKEGIKATIVRSGKFKALANPYESLTEEAKVQLQEQSDYLYSLFIGYVAKMRGVPVETAEKKFGQGREFFGKQAMTAGLVDQIGGFDLAYLKAQELGRKRVGKGKAVSSSNKAGVAVSGPSTSASAVHNTATPQGTPMPQALSLDILQAMAAAGIEVPADQTAATAEATAAAAALAAAKPDAAPAPEANAAAPVTAPATAATPAAPAADTVTVLTTMLATANADLAKARLDLSTAQANAQADAANLTAAMEIVRTSVRTMGVNFGVNKEAVASMSNTEALAEHGKLAVQFAAKYKTGGVAAVAPAADKVESATAGVDPAFLFAAQSLKKGK